MGNKITKKGGNVLNNTIEEVVYREEVTSQTNTIGSIVMGIFAVGFFVALIKELVSSSAPYAWAVTLALFSLFLVIGVTRLIIRKLKITITTKALTVAFTFAHKTVPLNNINRYSIDKNPNNAYRAQGMYVETVDGNRSWIYSASKSPKVVLDLKEGNYRRLIFSSNKPEQIADILANLAK